MKKAAVAFVLATASVLAMAQATPAGLWKTIDDDGKTEKSLVRIVETDGVLSGKVEKIIDPAKAKDATCNKCERRPQGQAHRRHDHHQRRQAGCRRAKACSTAATILDPDQRQDLQACSLKLIDGGKKLDVRGYIGSPMFGRTQTWIRASNE